MRENAKRKTPAYRTGRQNAKPQFKIRDFLKVFVFCILIFIFGFWISDFNCYAQQAVSSTDLIERARELDGQEVIYQGEAVGEVMRRGDFAWVNVHDGKNAIGVWISKELAGAIEYTGSFKVKGDFLEVGGKFNRACRIHGGDLDIHAVKLVRIRPGRPTSDPVVPEKKRFIIILSGVLLCLLIFQRLSRKR